MQLKLIALCAALLTAGAVSAGPVSQQCAPMEVLHNGTSGMSYRLDCSAGDWKLQYSGSVPAGTQAAIAQYRLRARHPDGSQFTQNRSVRVPSASLLGQALIREAVQLPGGALALRDCTEYNCAVYRPLGGDAPVAKATITVTPEMQRLTDERLALIVELQQKNRALEAKELELAQAQTDIAGLLTSSKAAHGQATSAERAAAEREQALQAQIDKLTDAQQLGQNQLKTELEQARAELARVQASWTESREQLAQLMAAPRASAAELSAIQAQHAKAQEDLARTSAQYEAQLESLKTKIRAEQADNAVREQAAQQVAQLQQELALMQAQLVEARAQVAAAQAAQAQPSAQVSALLAEQVAQRDRLQAQLQEVQALLAKKEAEQAAQSAQSAAALRAELAAATTGHQNALAQVESLTSTLQQVSAENDKMVAERISAYESARDLANQTLDLLEQYEALEKAKQEADAALVVSTNKILELNAKLEAASLTRELAMQASTAANADADTQHLKTQEVAARLTQAEADKARALAQLKALQTQLEAVKGAQVPIPAS